MHLQIVLGVLVTMAFMESASSQGPHCEQSCGGVEIPYPFGSKEGCFYNPDFQVICDQSSKDHKLYLGKSSNNAIIKSISTNVSEMEMMMFVAKDCYGIGNNEPMKKSPSLKLGKFQMSPKNRFVAMGCDTYAYMKGIRGKQTFRSGCVTTCNTNNIDEACTGVGCCEIPIPQGINSFEVFITSYNNHSNIINFNPCSYAFVIQEGEYKFSSASLLEFPEEKMPMLLEWAIGDSTCDQVNEKSPDTLLCKGISECDKNYTGPGYRCRCPKGYEGNPYIENNCTNINECAKNRDICTGNGTCVDSLGSYSCVQDKSLIIGISVGTTAAVLLILIIATWVHLGLKKRKLLILREKFFKQNGGLMLQQRISGNGGSQDQAKVFTLEELQKATNNYDESWIIGKGGYGTVYKGILSDNRIVAIKKSKLIDQTRTQIEQFINEVVILSQINHRNVVKLIGCCLETEVPLLVYEFIPNGTLSDHIHDERKSMEITWGIRLKIATETAGALSYLHFSASIPIIHRDVKPMNILLDESYIAKVADFGASRLIPMDQNELATMVQGTLGYLDPEYLHSNQLTEKSDVYSFGVVLVELLTGKMVLDFDRPQKDRNLTKYFLSALTEERLLEVLDEHLQLKEVPHEIIQVSRLAERCLCLKGDERPTMKEVALELEGILASMIDEHPWVKSSSNEDDTEYLLKEPMEDYESTDSSYKRSMTFYSMIDKPSGR